MRTCECCFREHTGEGRMCAQCNNPGRVRLPKRDSRKENDRGRVEHLDMADGAARSDDDGWFYDDDEE